MRTFYLLLLAGVIALSGCASKPYVYDPGSSMAMNIALAGDFDDNKLKDVVVPEDTVSSIRTTKGVAAASMAAGYSIPLFGLSSPAMAALNLLQWSLQVEGPAAKRSITAWMPKEVAGDDPVATLNALFEDAVHKTAIEYGYAPENGYAKPKHGYQYLAVGFSNPKNMPIGMGVAIRKPEALSHTPLFTGSTTESYFFQSDKAMHNFYVFNDENRKHFSELGLLVALSKKLPKWIYIYVPPKKVYINEKDTVEFPLIVSGGEILYFIKPT